ncbi:MAG TPA: protease pro-enzyme activation domain-containing protein, partial [Candidatus Binataceae bacterium]|nr:protease pro-enzyme activation domain-containing protein [Candidatus Binataceae bacterium]
MARFRTSAIFQSVLGTLGVLIFCASATVYAQSAPAPTPRPGMVALKNNNPRIDPAILKGPMDKSSKMTFNVVLALRNEDQLNTLIEEQQNPASPNYHHWLTGDEFNARFGPNPADYTAVAQWLKSEGFAVVEVNQQSRYIRCTGTTAQVDATFGTAMASAGNGLFTNTADPQIPARFDGIVGSIQGLENLHASYSNARKHSPPTPPSPAGKSTAGPGPKNSVSQPDTNNGGYQAFAPQDLQIYYDEQPVLGAGYTGTGDCIAIVGDSDYLPSAVTLFTSTFGTPAANINTVLSSNKNGTYTSPGRNGDEQEALLDLEWSHSAAPGATINFYLGDDGNTNDSYGGLDDALNRAVNDNT